MLEPREQLLWLGRCVCKHNSPKEQKMQSIVIPVGVGVALLASCGLAAAQGHMHGFGGGGVMHAPGGGGGMHAPGGGGFHAPGGGGGFRSGPSMAPRGTFQAPCAYRAERAPRMEHGY